MKLLIRTKYNPASENFTFICLYKILFSLLGQIERGNSKLFLPEDVTSWIISWRISDNDFQYEEELVDKNEFTNEIFELSVCKEGYRNILTGQIDIPFNINPDKQIIPIDNSTQMLFGFNSSLEPKERIKYGVDLISEFIFNYFEYEEGKFILPNNSKIKEWIENGSSCKYFTFDEPLSDLKIKSLSSKINNFIPMEKAFLYGPTYQSSNDIILKGFIKNDKIVPKI